MLPASADTSARPNSRQSSRKVRSDKGIPKGPRKPRQPARGTLKGDGNGSPDHWEIPLRGGHGSGHSLRIAQEDHEDIMKMSEDGKRIYVVVDRTGHPTVVVTTKAPPTPGNHQTITLARFLAGEMHGGRRLRHKDGNPFNLHRDNLETEVKATGERFPIDWDKAAAGREAFLSLVQPHNEDSAVQH